MKRTIAIVCGGDTSEFEVSLRSAQGIYSFIDKERYTLYIVEMRGTDWHVQLPDGTKTPVDRNDFSFRLDGAKVVFDFAYLIPVAECLHGRTDMIMQSISENVRCAYRRLFAASRAVLFQTKCDWEDEHLFH